MHCFGELRHEGQIQDIVRNIVEGIPCGENINLVNQSANETLMEMVEVQQSDMKPVELLLGLPPMREVGCATNFVGQVVMQTGKSK